MPLPKNEHCTYADYLTWDTDEKYELFDGVPVMQARPTEPHQYAETQLVRLLGNFLDGKPCDVYSEFTVLLPDHAQQSADDTQNVFVPDVSVICDPEKIKHQHCFGAPTLVMEILSPSTAKADKLLKLNKYQQAGIPEYWIVSPQEQNAMVFTLQGGIYQVAAVYNTSDTAAKVFSLPGCTIDISKIFRKQQF